MPLSPFQRTLNPDEDEVLGPYADALSQGTKLEEPAPNSEPNEWLPSSAPPPMPRPQPPPAPRRPAPVDDELRRAQDEDADSAQSDRLSNLLLQAGTRGRASLPARTGSAVGELGQRRAADAAAMKARQSADLADPNSDISRRVRERFKGLEIGQKFSARLGADYDRLPASELPGIDKLLEAEMRHASDDPSLVAYRNAQVAELGRKAEEGARKRKESLAYLDAVKRKYPQLVPVLKDAEGYSEQALGKLVDSMEAQTRFTRDMFRQNDQQEFSGAEADENRAAAIAKENRQNQREDEELVVPGFVSKPGTRINITEAEKMRDRISGTAILRAGIGQLAALVKKHGVSLVPGEIKADLESAEALLQLESKGDTLFQLGVLAGPDVGFLKQVTGDPTSWKALLGGPEAIQRRLANMLKYANTRLAERAKGLNLVPAVATTDAAPGAPAPRPAAPRAQDGVSADAAGTVVPPGKYLIRKPDGELVEVDAAEWRARPGLGGTVLVKKGG